MPSLLHMLALTSTVALLALTGQHVDAHGKLLRPPSTIRAASRISAGQQFDYVGELRGSDVFQRGNGRRGWVGNAQNNQREFNDAFKANGYTTLRQLFQAHENVMIPRFPGRTDNVCGFTDSAAPPVALPADGIVEWGNTAGRFGFQSNHYGPCEIWCDDKLAMLSEDCRATFGMAFPARMPIDVAQCVGAKRLQFLWLAVHFSKWQYWLNCVPLAGATETAPPANAVAALPVVPAMNATNALLTPATVPTMAPANTVTQPVGAAPTTAGAYTPGQVAPLSGATPTADVVPPMAVAPAPATTAPAVGTDLRSRLAARRAGRNKADGNMAPAPAVAPAAMTVSTAGNGIPSDPYVQSA